MKSFLIVMLSMGIFGHAFAQNLDLKFAYLVDYSKITIDLESGNRLIIHARKVQYLRDFQNLDSVLVAFQKNYATIKPTLAENVNSKTATYLLLSNGQNQLNLTETVSTKQRFQFAPTADPVLVKTLQDTLLIASQNHILGEQKYVPIPEKRNLIPSVYYTLIINSLDDVSNILKTGGLNPKIQQCLLDIEQYPHHNLQKTGFSYKLNYAPNTNTPTFKAVETSRSPFLTFHQTFGVGVFRNQLVPNSQTEMAFVPSKNHNVGYTLGWRSMFWTSQDAQTGRLRTNSNGVLQVGFTFYDFKKTNPTRVDTDHVLFGIYLGRVVSRNGDIFEKNTWNLSMTVAARGIVKIQPEVYFNGFFKNAMPGLRVQVGF